MEFAGVANLQLDDEAVIWPSQTFSYRDITSVNWFATITENSINGIPTGKSYQANLVVQLLSGEKIAITGENGVFGGLSKKAFESLAHASELISALSFAYRVSKIEKKFNERRFFQYGDYQFHSSGDLFRNGVEIGSLVSSKTRLFINNVFELTIVPERQDRSFLGRFKDNSIKLNLHADRDCMLYMLNKAYGIQFQGSSIRKKRYSPRQTFYEAVTRFGALLASADGNPEASELLNLKKFFDLSSDVFPEGAKIYNDQLSSPLGAEQILEAFKECFSDARELKETFLFGMAEVALSDGFAHPKEVALLREAARILSIDDQTAARILESVGIATHWGRDKSRSTRSGPLTRAQCCAVLGVNINATEDEIRTAYRDLVRRYHPDILRSQNLPEAELERLGTLMRAINEAYEWIKDAS